MTADDQGSELVSVFTAPDEVTANIVKGLLEGEGIQADVEMSGTTWGGRAAVADMLGQRQTQHWGDVVVASEDAARSLELIRAYEPKGSEQACQEPMWSRRYSAISLRGACVTGGLYYAVGAYVASAGDIIARLAFDCTASVCFLAYGLVMMSWQKKVPARFRQANKQVGSGLLAAGVLSGAFFVGELGYYEIPRGVAMSVYLLILAASTYGTIRRYPAAAQQQEEHNV